MDGTESKQSKNIEHKKSPNLELVSYDPDVLWAAGGFLQITQSLPISINPHYHSTYLAGPDADPLGPIDWIDYYSNGYPNSLVNEDYGYPATPRFGMRSLLGEGAPLTVLDTHTWDEAFDQYAWVWPESYGLFIKQGYGDLYTGGYWINSPSVVIFGYTMATDSGQQIWSGYENTSGVQMFQWSGWFFLPDESHARFNNADPTTMDGWWGQNAYVQRGQFRLSQPRWGWVGGADLYLTKLDGTIGWDNYSMGIAMGRVLRLRNGSFVQRMPIHAFTGSTGTEWTPGSTDRVTNQNTVPMPDTSIGSMASGFIGKINFAVWGETPQQWQDRTGMTLTGAPLDFPP